MSEIVLATENDREQTLELYQAQKGRECFSFDGRMYEASTALAGAEGVGLMTAHGVNNKNM